jgi:hypothetical protein
MCRKALLAHLAEVECDPGTASFFLSREVAVPSLRPELPCGRKHAFMVRNAVSAPDYFLIASQVSSNSIPGSRYDASCSLGLPQTHLNEIRGADVVASEPMSPCSRPRKPVSGCARY